MKEMIPTVYVLDDDSSVLISLKRLIQSADFHVETFSLAAEFLEHKLSSNPSCLVLDVSLPDIDGFKLQDELLQKKHFHACNFYNRLWRYPDECKSNEKGGG